MKQSRVLTGYVFGSILTLGGLATAVFYDKSSVSRYGVSGGLGIPMWVLGIVVAVFGVVVLVRSFLLQRQK
jgi:hypothetical protein